jgi:hypothetical protein
MHQLHYAALGMSRTPYVIDVLFRSLSILDVKRVPERSIQGSTLLDVQTT